MTVTHAVDIYSSGFVSCSVCAPAAMPREEIESSVNRANPTGISSGWTVSDDQQFADGSAHPHPCELNPDRLHYLLNC